MNDLDNDKPLFTQEEIDEILRALEAQSEHPQRKNPDLASDWWEPEEEPNLPPVPSDDYDKACQHTLAYRRGEVYRCSYCDEKMCGHGKVKLVPMIFSTIKVCVECGADLGKVIK